jgi:hypothetical protein
LTGFYRPAYQPVASGLLALPYGDAVCSMHMGLSVTIYLPCNLAIRCDGYYFVAKPFHMLPFIFPRTLTNSNQLISIKLNMFRVLTCCADLSCHLASNTSAMDIDPRVADNAVPLQRKSSSTIA